MSKCIVVLLGPVLHQCPESVNSFISKGWSGRLILKQGQSPIEALSTRYPSTLSIIQGSSITAENYEEQIESATSRLVIINAEDMGQPLADLLDVILERYYVIIIAYPYPFPVPDNSHPMSFLRPKQSYMFQDCKDITHMIEHEKCGIYIEHCPSYTRRDRLQSIDDVLTKLGGANCILAEQLPLEIAFTQGLASKYGA